MTRLLAGDPRLEILEAVPLACRSSREPIGILDARSNGLPGLVERLRRKMLRSAVFVHEVEGVGDPHEEIVWVERLDDVIVSACLHRRKHFLRPRTGP